MAKITEDQAFLPAFCGPTAVFLVVLLCELLAILITFLLSPLPMFDLELLGVVSMLLQWMGLLSAACLCGLRKVIARWSLASQIVLSYLTILVVASVTSAIVVVLFDYSWWWMLNNVFLAAIIVGIAIRYFVLQYLYRMKKQAELSQRIEALQARIRPHFLFNTLNAIATMVTIEPEKAEQMTLDLADITRESMQQPTLVTLSKELALCRKYLGIESQRFGARLEVLWDIDQASESIKIPNLLLQPIVENAIYHGIQRRIAPGCVTIKTQTNNKYSVITISNPSPDQSAPKVQGQQMAMDNISRRLQAVYGDAARCGFKEQQGYYTVTVRIPV